MAELQQTVQQYLQKTRQLHEGLAVRRMKAPYTIYGGTGSGPWILGHDGTLVYSSFLK